MLILLRHGRTPNNEKALLQGQYDSPLDSVGVAQAVTAGDYIRRRWKVDEVVTSSLTRTRQTAEHAGFGTGDVIIDDRWREIDFGEYDQRRIGEVLAELTGKWTEDIAHVPERGESMAAMHERVGGAFAELAERAIQRNILVVTHATPIKSAAVWAMGGSAPMILNLWVNLATVSVIGEYHGRLVLQEFNTKVVSGQH